MRTGGRKLAGVERADTNADGDAIRHSVFVFCVLCVGWLIIN